jgi:hypothetical protein
MKRVLVESPYAGEVDDNEAYARACLLDCLRRGEAPFASHLLYTQVLDDAKPGERQLGIAAGLVWGACADLVAVYIDRGVSSGMRRGIETATDAGLPIEERRLPPERPEDGEVKIGQPERPHKKISVQRAKPTRIAEKREPEVPRETKTD